MAKPKLPGGQPAPRRLSPWEKAEGAAYGGDDYSDDGSDPFVPDPGPANSPATDNTQNNPDPHSLGLNENNPFTTDPTPNTLPGQGSTGGGGSGMSTSAIPASSYGGLQSILQQLMEQQRQPRQDPARDAMMARYNTLMDQYSKPVDPNDPSIKGAVDSYEGNVGRSVANYREFAAERAHSQGVGSGAFDAQVGNAIQAGGRSVAGLSASMMRDELTQRRQNLDSMMNQAASFLSEGERQALQQEMHATDAALQALQIQSSRDVGMAGVGATNRGLDLSNQHFYDDLTYRQANDAANRDDSDLKNLLDQLFGGGA